LLTFVGVGILASGKIQPRYLVAFGFGMLALGNWLLSFVETPQTDFHAFIIPLVIMGIGMSQIFVPMTVATVGAVPEAIVPSASAFSNLARQLGGSVSTAILVTVAQRSSSRLRLARPVDHAQPSRRRLVRREPWRRARRRPRLEPVRHRADAGDRARVRSGGDDHRDRDDPARAARAPDAWGALDRRRRAHERTRARRIALSP
jgi:hypothetical protein